MSVCYIYLLLTVTVLSPYLPNLMKSFHMQYWKSEVSIIIMEYFKRLNLRHILNKLNTYLHSYSRILDWHFNTMLVSAWSPSDNSKLSICTTDDSRTVGMSISFMCACVKFVIHRSSNSTTCKGPENHHGEEATLDGLPSQKSPVMQIESSLICMTEKYYLKLLWWEVYLPLKLHKAGFRVATSSFQLWGNKTTLHCS